MELHRVGLFASIGSTPNYRLSLREERIQGAEDVNAAADADVFVVTAEC